VTNRLCSIPALVLSLTHFRDDIRTTLATKPTGPSAAEDADTAVLGGTSRPYSHHDVYLRPALADSTLHTGGSDLPLENYMFLDNDRYHFFRSRTMTARWEVEMRLADDQDTPISIAVRLDQLVRILDAFKTPEAEPTEDRDELDGCIDKAAEYFYGAVRPLNPIGMGDIISTLKFQLILNKIMVSSWPSATNLGGFVMTVGSSDLQLRMLRDVPHELLASSDAKSSGTGPAAGRKSVRASVGSMDSSRRGEGKDIPMFPLMIDHLYMDTAFIELYVRNWNKNGDGTDPSTASMEARRSMAYRLSLGGKH
jgi:hypothetical protein